MTTPMLMTQHPTEELLAAFVDDRLDTAAREPVTDHLASCGECREIVLMATAFQDEPIPVPVPVPHPDFGRRRWMAAIASVAAAGVIGVFLVRPSAWFGYRVDDLVAASQSVKERPSEGRLAGGFPYAPKSDTKRGVPTPTDPDFTDGLAEKWKLYEIKVTLAEAKEKGKTVDPHIDGLTTLLIAKERKDFDEAVADLEKALATTRGAEHDVIAIDLAAALIGRARWSGDEDDYRYALRLSNDVLTRKQSPEALWNRAVATAALYQKAEALRAWDEYLKVETNPQWVEEATSRKTRIESDY
jgi:Putative zinc-finger